MRVIDLASLSMISGSGIAESKIPLWFADGTIWPTSPQVAGQVVLNDGSWSPPASSHPIFTLASSWLSSLNFALEITAFCTSSSSPAYFELYDFTSSSVLPISQVSTSSTTAVVIRSGKFTLTPSHSYSITGWTTTSGQDADIIDASLIVFP